MNAAHRRLVGLAVAMFGLWACAEDHEPANAHSPLDPASDWSPSSDWAAVGDREGGGDPGSGDPWGGGTADASADITEDWWAPPDAWEDDPDVEDVEEEDIDEEDVEEEDASGSGGSPGPHVLYLSADDSNSQASPIIARKLMNERYTVPWWVVRVHEFLNYYDAGYPPSPPGRLDVVSHFRAIDYPAGLYALQIGVKSPAVSNASRRRVNLTLVLDTSGSMSGDPIDLEREVVRAIASSLRAGDIVSMVEWDTARSIRLSGHHVFGPGDPVLLAEATSLTSGGGTDLHSGLVTGYQLARENYEQGYMNRLILVSDGQANVGVTDEELIAENSNAGEDEGIFLVGVGVGNGYNDTLMDQVTDTGRGAYIFVDSRDEAWKMFGDRFVQSIEVAAYDVQVALTLPDVFRIEEFHGEEYSDVAKEVTPQHLAPNDAMVFHQLLAASSPNRVFADDRIGVEITWRDGPEAPTRSARWQDTLQHLIRTRCPEMRKADAIVTYAQALMLISSALERGNELEAHDTCTLALSIISSSADALADGDLHDISYLMDSYCRAIAHGSLFPSPYY